jgi:glycosyltransferase involved in cell wall biosynthesis
MIYLTIQPEPLAKGRSPASVVLPRARLLDLTTHAQAMQRVGARLMLASPRVEHLAGHQLLAEITPDREGFEFAPLPGDEAFKWFAGGGDGKQFLRDLVAAAAIVEVRNAGSAASRQAWTTAAQLSRKRIWVIDDDAKQRIEAESQYLQEADAAFVELLGPPQQPATASARVQYFQRPLITDAMLLPPKLVEQRQKQFRKRDVPVRVAVAGPQVALTGTEQVIKAIARLRRLSVTIMLDVIGEGVDLPVLREIAHDAGIAQQVRFHGELASAELADVWSGCAALVIARLDAGSSPHLAAALARALPVIAYTGAREYAAAERAGAVLLVPKADVDSLADAMLKLHTNRDQLAQMMQSAVNHASTLTLDLMHFRRAELAAELLPRQVAGARR